MKLCRFAGGSSENVLALSAICNSTARMLLISLVYVMFPIYSPITKHLPFLLSGSRGVDSPPFYRYYEDVKTASVRLDDYGCRGGDDTTSTLPSCFIALGDSSCPRTPGLRITGQPPAGVSCGDGRLSQVPAKTSCECALLPGPDPE